jgi:hypothetical protein
VGDAATRARAPGPHRPPDRYGVPASGGRRLGTYVVTGIVAALALAALLTLALHKSLPPVAAGLRGYDVVSDTAVRIRFEVHKAPLAEAVCTVRARDRSGAEAGRADVTVGPRRDSRRVTEVSFELATRARAVSGELTGCRITRDH